MFIIPIENAIRSSTIRELIFNDDAAFSRVQHLSACTVAAVATDHHLPSLFITSSGFRSTQLYQIDSFFRFCFLLLCIKTKSTRTWAVESLEVDEQLLREWLEGRSNTGNSSIKSIGLILNRLRRTTLLMVQKEEHFYCRFHSFMLKFLWVLDGIATLRARVR